MLSSRELLIVSSASEGDSPEAATVLEPWRSSRAISRTHSAGDGSWRLDRRGSRDSEPPGGGNCTVLDEWEEAELALLSPEIQKRERRRIANRDCARRIRQRKTELLAELTASVDVLQADNSRLLATLTEVTRCWRDTTIENCELRGQIALLQAVGGRASVGSSGSVGASLLASPDALGHQLLSPGWPSPMVL